MCCDAEAANGPTALKGECTAHWAVSAGCCATVPEASGVPRSFSKERALSDSSTVRRKNKCFAMATILCIFHSQNNTANLRKGDGGEGG